MGECPEGKKAAPNGATCICEDLSILDDNDKIQCVTACPDTHEVGDDGVTCERKWQLDSPVKLRAQPDVRAICP